MNPGDAIGSNVFGRLALNNQTGSLSGPVRPTTSVWTEAQSDRYLIFGARQNSSDRLAIRSLDRKAERC
jgi:hypothetical protein